MKKILIPFLLLVFVFSLAEDANAQRKKRRTKKEDTEESTRSKRSSNRDAEDEDYKSFSDKLVYDINIGNLALSNGYFGFSLKPAVGYKLHERIIPGIGLKYFYNLYSDTGVGQSDINLNDYGAFAFTRLKITEAFFAHVEYSYTSFDDEYIKLRGTPLDFMGDRISKGYPLVGAGYASGFGDWRSTIQLLFIADEFVRDVGVYPIEFWFGFTKNF